MRGVKHLKDTFKSNTDGHRKAENRPTEPHSGRTAENDASVISFGDREQSAGAPLVRGNLGFPKWNLLGAGRR